MRVVNDNDVARSCAVCERSLLLGEEATRYSSNDGEWVDVCVLCRAPALRLGWTKEGSPSSPVVEFERRRFRFPRRVRRDASGSSSPNAQLAGAAVARVSCFSVACETFNESAFRRTVSGVAKSLGQPWVSLVYLTGVKPEVVITVAWELSWYQYRVVAAESPTIRLVERGYEFDELDERFTVINASFDSEMALVPSEDSPDPSTASPSSS